MRFLILFDKARSVVILGTEIAVLRYNAAVVEKRPWLKG